MLRNVTRAVFVLGWLANSAWAADDGALGNWFNDPYLQVRHGFAGCPVPLGPFITRAEMRVQEHSRAERGTRCYLEGECKKPNSYLYDPDIAHELAARFAKSKAYGASSLWVTVQRRFVWIEGCVHDQREARALETMARRVADVQYAIVNVTANPRVKTPYPTLEGRR